MVFPTPETLFDRLAAHLPPMRGWGAAAVAGAAFLGGTGIIAFHYALAWAGGLLLLAGFVADGLGQAWARRDGRDRAPLLPFGVMLALFGFALAEPPWALAAMFAMFALSVLTLLSGPRIRLVHWLAAAGLLAACFLPNRFSLFAYLIGIACFVRAGQGLAVRA